MQAIDTNILVRFILMNEVEDAIQTQQAVKVVRQGVVIPMTVLLETGWVLSRVYKVTRQLLATALEAVLDLPTVHVADEEAIRWALGRFAAGGDLADMLHLIAAGDASAFITFDRSIARDAGGNAPLPVVTLGAD